MPPPSPPSQVASRLLQHPFRGSVEHEVAAVYLGTTTNFLAAHRFYEKNGLVEIAPIAHPAAFPVMAVGTKFYQRSLRVSVNQGKYRTRRPGVLGLPASKRRRGIALQNQSKPPDTAFNVAGGVLKWPIQVSGTCVATRLISVRAALVGGTD